MPVGLKTGGQMMKMGWNGTEILDENQVATSIPGSETRNIYEKSGKQEFSFRH
jgi:hypothetical protein